MNTLENHSDNSIPLPDVFDRTAQTGKKLPLVLEPAARDLETSPDAFLHWMSSNSAALDRCMDEYGAILFRGFALRDSHQFGMLADQLGPFTKGYVGGATPRSRIHGSVYEATRLPPSFGLGLHQEMSYLPYYPKRIAFYCQRPADIGGETILADMRLVTRSLSEETRSTFAGRDVVYYRNLRAPDHRYPHEFESLRNYHRSWSDTLETSNETEAEKRCTERGLAFRWEEDGSLTTISQASAFARHSRSDQEIWFNHVTTLHPNALSLGKLYSKIRRYYDSKAIPPVRIEVTGHGDVRLEDILSVYHGLKREERVVKCLAGDFLLLDNIFIAHGRRPFEGNRDLRVALLK